MYITVTVLAVVINGIAAVTYLIGHDYLKAQADMKRVPRSWVPVLGTFLALGSLRLLAGFAVPALGVAAAVGLVVYFSERWSPTCGSALASSSAGRCSSPSRWPPLAVNL
jgi:hypothetical protein